MHSTKVVFILVSWCLSSHVYGQCVDSNAGCNDWANVWSPGECYVNPNYMLFSCKLSCRTCGCPGGFTAFQGKCYYIESVLRKWNDAKSNCVSLGGYLADVPNAHVQSFITSLANDKDLWIGLDDKSSEGSWVNVDGQAASFNGWNVGEPTTSTSTNCAVMRYTDGYDWVAEDCSKLFQSVCQYPQPSDTWVVVCPSSAWSLVGGICYYKDTTQRTWEDAKYNCYTVGGHLADIPHAGVQAYMKVFVTSTSWIGLSDVESEGTWKNVDGAGNTYSNFAAGGPNGGTNENCLTFVPSSNHEWHDTPCSTSLPSICQYPSPGGNVLTPTTTPLPTTTLSYCDANYPGSSIDVNLLLASDTGFYKNEGSGHFRLVSDLPFGTSEIASYTVSNDITCLGQCLKNSCCEYVLYAEGEENCLLIRNTSE